MRLKGQKLGPFLVTKYIVIRNYSYQNISIKRFVFLFLYTPLSAKPPLFAGTHCEHSIVSPLLQTYSSMKKNQEDLADFCAIFDLPFQIELEGESRNLRMG